MAEHELLVLLGEMLRNRKPGVDHARIYSSWGMFGEIPFIDETWKGAQEVSERLSVAYTKLSTAERSKVTATGIYEMLDELEDGLDEKSDTEKKELLGQIIESIDIDPEARRRGPWVTHVKFKVPVTFAPVRMDDEMLELFKSIGVDKFNEYTQYDWYSDKSRVNDDTDGTVVLMSRVEGK